MIEIEFETLLNCTLFCLILKTMLAHQLFDIKHAKLHLILWKECVCVYTNTHTHIYLLIAY